MIFISNSCNCSKYSLAVNVFIYHITCPFLLR
nr:MAG TPA: hypothetical protein [Caudoviricetes sp.]